MSAPDIAGLVAAAELIDARKKVIVVDQEGEQSLGGQAFWSLGGLFLVDSPEQRRLGIRDSRELALADWLGTAAFDREEDFWPRQWAEAYVDFAAGEKRSWLRQRGIRFFPVVGWAERGGGNASGHGNSVPRFPSQLGHRTGRARAIRAARAGRRERRLVDFQISPSRERAHDIGVFGTRLFAATCSLRATANAAQKSSRETVGTFELKAGAVDRRLRRHRRQSRTGAQKLAAAAWPRAAANDRRRAGLRRRPDAGDYGKPPVARSSIATGCGITSRASRTTRRFGAITASVFCRGRRRCGSMRVAGACRCRFIRASIRSPRSNTSWRPATIIPGSS